MTSATAYDDGATRGSGTDERAIRVGGRAWTRGGRLAGALLLGVAAASMPGLLLLVLLSTDPPVTPPVLARLLVPMTLLPGIAGLLVRRAHAARIEVTGGVLRVVRPDATVEIACPAIEGVTPWRIPLPGPGFSLVLRSGRRAGLGLELADPAPLLAALADEGARGAREAVKRPAMVYAAERAPRPDRPIPRLLARYPLFALVPGAVLFNLHQHIAYGGALGEWYSVGPSAYLRTFAVHWATTTAYLVLYASAWRSLAEGLCFAAACIAPERLPSLRRRIEIAIRVLYYGGVPALLALRLLA